MADNTSTRQLRWQKLTGRLGLAGSDFLLSYVRLPQSEESSPGYHRHDFAELFWVVSGSGQHQTSEGTKSLRAGDCIFVRPEHAHALHPASGQSLCFYNLAFPNRHLVSLQRLFPAVCSHFWPRAKSPLSIHLTEVLRQWLQKEARLLAKPSVEALFHFLLGFHLRLKPPTASPLPPDIPQWLVAAYPEFSTPDGFSGGVNQLAAICKRSPETVSRTVRHHLGITAVEWVNRLRMEHACHELRLTDRSILDILLECGFAGTSQFYKRFNESFGMSPAAYRRQFSKIA